LYRNIPFVFRNRIHKEVFRRLFLIKCKPPRLGPFPSRRAVPRGGGRVDKQTLQLEFGSVTQCMFGIYPEVPLLTSKERGIM